MKSQPTVTSEIAKKTKALLKNQVNTLATTPQPLHESAPESNGLRDHIATRAYALYKERGCQHGCDLQDWLDAEREILSRQPAV